MGELLALGAAGAFGTSHFAGGMLSRRHGGVVVALYAQLGGTLLSLAALALLGAGAPTAAALGWGALSGLGTGVGVAFLFRAMARGAMSVVVPISDTGAVALPALAGLALLGERPHAAALTGMLLAVPAIWLVSRGAAGVAGRGGVPDALVAGLGFAVQFMAMAQVPAAAGQWPVVLSRAASVLTIGVTAACYRTRPLLPARTTCGALGTGALGTLAIMLYLAAAQRQPMSIATVLAALYPAIPVLLGLLLLGERLRRAQVAGLCCAAAAIALIAL